MSDQIDELEQDEGFTGSFETESKPDQETPEPETTDETTDETAEDAEKSEATKAEPEAEEDTEKPKRKPPTQRIQELTAKYREEQRKAQDLEVRLAALEQRTVKPEVQAEGQANEAPNPDKYEFGSLDENYINDLVAYRTSQTLNQHLEAENTRRQQTEAQQRQQQEAQAIQEKAAGLLQKGSEVHEDYASVVLEAGMRGDYDLGQPTFEAAAEADNGAEILYLLATNPDEASKVATMSAVQQAKYVFKKDAELSVKTPARAPKAPPPPGSGVKGASGKFEVAADTDDLDAFEKMYFK